MVRGIIRVILAVIRLLNRGSTDWLRREFNFISRLIPVPSGVRVEHLSLGGVPAELLTPDGAAAGSAMMYIHGGGYAIGSPRTHRAMAARLAVQAGMKVYLPDYRLAPEHPFPAALEDVVLAWQALQQREPRLVLGGESAGGGLSVALCHRARESGIRLPEKLYLQSPWLDLTLSSPSRRERNRMDPMIKSDWLESQFARHYAAGQDRRLPGLSPVLGSADGFPPTLIQVGTHEVLYDDSVYWAEKLRAAGVPVQLHIGQGLWHAWPYFAPLVPEANDALRQAGQWLRVH